jgi:uncharacterized protein (TIGR03435 family)
LPARRCYWDWQPHLWLPRHRRRFDVASIKLVKGPVVPHGVGLLIDHGKLTIEAGQLRQIIGLAFGIQRVLVQGSAEWCDEDMLDIVAKTDNVEATRDQIRPMLQTLLAERFKLATPPKFPPTFSSSITPNGLRKTDG